MRNQRAEVWATLTIQSPQRVGDAGRVSSQRGLYEKGEKTKRPRIEATELTWAARQAAQMLVSDECGVGKILRNLCHGAEAAQHSRFFSSNAIY